VQFRDYCSVLTESLARGDRVIYERTHDRWLGVAQSPLVGTS